jgi:excinuclease UvrABC nuclease subunit
MENWTLYWTKLNQLTEAAAKAIPDNVPGVYRLSYKSEDGNFYVFYIGKADDIKKRLCEHISDSEMNVCIRNYLKTKVCYYRYAKVTASYIREAAEKQMYNHYQPVCNHIEPGGRDDVRVNLS